MMIGSFDNGQNELIWLMRNRPVAGTVNPAQAGAASGTPAQPTGPQRSDQPGPASTLRPVRVNLDITALLPAAMSGSLASAQSALQPAQAPDADTGAARASIFL
jgi:hypothetical protein